MTVSVSGGALQRNGNPWFPLGWNSVAGLYVPSNPYLAEDVGTPSTHYPAGSYQGMVNDYGPAYQQFVATTGAGGLSPTLVAMQEWNANCVRIQVVQNILANSTIIPAGIPGANGVLTFQKAYLNQLDAIVAACTAAGMVCIFTINNNFKDNLGGPSAGTISATTTTAWQYLANQYKTNLDVVFELENEPSGAQGSNAGTQYTAWGTRTTAGTWVGDHQILTTAIRAIAANNVILVDGFDPSLTAGHQWAPGFPQGTFNYSTMSMTGGNIGYAVHPQYNNYVGGKTTTAYGTEWGWLTGSAPVVITEFYLGGNNNLTAKQWKALSGYLATNNIGFIGWVFDHFGDQGAMVKMARDESDYTKPWAWTATTAGKPAKEWMKSFASTPTPTPGTGITVSGPQLLWDGKPFIPVGWNSVACLDVEQNPYVNGKGVKGGFPSRKQYRAARQQFTSHEGAGAGTDSPTCAAMQAWGTNMVRFQVVQNLLCATDPIDGVPIKAATSTSTTLTFTVQHQYKVGDTVVVGGMWPNTYDGHWQVASVIGTGTIKTGFTVTSTVNPGTATIMGSLADAGTLTYSYWYLERIQNMVNRAEEAGFCVMLSMQNNLPEPAGLQHGPWTRFSTLAAPGSWQDGAWRNGRGPAPYPWHYPYGPLTSDAHPYLDVNAKQNTQTAWSILAPAFADDPLVIYETYNEPEIGHGHFENTAIDTGSDGVVANTLDGTTGHNIIHVKAVANQGTDGFEPNGGTIKVSTTSGLVSFTYTGVDVHPTGGTQFTGSKYFGGPNGTLHTDNNVTGRGTRHPDFPTWKVVTQALIDTIRLYATNVIVVMPTDTFRWPQTQLANFTGYFTYGDLTDSLNNLAYSVHAYAVQHTSSTWDRDWGWLCAHAPVIETEFYSWGGTHKGSTYTGGWDDYHSGRTQAYEDYHVTKSAGQLGWVFDHFTDQGELVNVSGAIGPKGKPVPDETIPWTWRATSYPSYDPKLSPGAGELVQAWMISVSNKSVYHPPGQVSSPDIPFFDIRIWSDAENGQLVGNPQRIAAASATRVLDAPSTFSVDAFLSDPEMEAISKGLWVELWIGRLGPGKRTLWASGIISQVTKNMDRTGVYTIDFDDPSMFLAEWRASDGANYLYPQYAQKKDGILSVLNGRKQKNTRVTPGNMGLLPPGWTAVWVDYRSGSSTSAGATFTISGATFSIQTGPGLGNVATYTTTTPHGYSSGNVVNISGMLPVGYNATRIILNVPSATTFQTFTAANANSTQGGTVTLGQQKVATTNPPGWGDSWFSALDTGLNSLDQICAHYNIHWRVREGSTPYNGVVEIGPLYDSANLGIWGGESLRIELAKRMALPLADMDFWANTGEAYLRGISVTTAPQFHETFDNIWNIYVCPGMGSGSNEVTLAPFWAHEPDYKNPADYDPVDKVFRYFYELYQPYEYSRQYFVRDKHVAHWSGNLYELIAWHRQDGTFEYGIMNRTSVEKYGPREAMLTFGNKKINDPDSLLSAACGAVDYNSDPVSTWIFPCMHPRIDANGVPPLVKPGMHLGIKYHGLAQPVVPGAGGELEPVGDLVYADYNGGLNPDMADPAKKVLATRVIQVDESWSVDAGYQATYTMGHGKYRKAHWESAIAKQLEITTKVPPDTVKTTAGGKTLDNVPIILSKDPNPIAYENSENQQIVLNPGSYVMTNAHKDSYFGDGREVHFDFHLYDWKQMLDFIFLRPSHYNSTSGITIPSGAEFTARDYADVGDNGDGKVDWGFYCVLRIPMHGSKGAGGGGFFDTTDGTLSDYKDKHGKPINRLSWFPRKGHEAFPWTPGHWRVSVGWSGGVFKATVTRPDLKQKVNKKPYSISTHFNDKTGRLYVKNKKGSEDVAAEQWRATAQVGWHAVDGDNHLLVNNVSLSPWVGVMSK